MAKRSKGAMDIDISGHHLVPRHEVVDRKTAKGIIEDLGVEPANLPKIFTDDPAIRRLDLMPGDIVKVTRSSRTAGKTVIYRLVVER